MKGRRMWAYPMGIAVAVGLCVAGLTGTSIAKTVPADDHPEDEDTMMMLESMGYVDRNVAKDASKLGVTLRTDSAFPGYNLYSTRSRASAQLVDNTGKVVHEWHGREGAPAWMHIELLPNGDLLAIAKDVHIVRLDWDSNLVWRMPMRAHHDLHIGTEGRTVVLDRTVRKREFDGVELPVLEDRFNVLNAKGDLIFRRDLFPLLRHYIPDARIEYIKKEMDEGESTKDIVTPESSGDIFHTNSVDVLRRPIRGIAPKGAILISVRQLNRIFIVDRMVTKVLWQWGKGELQRQHHATQLDNGNIMVFDNGVYRERSRVLEVNPRNRKIVWRWSRKGFYTNLRGSAQKLPNGNVLATLSDTGNALEISRKGDVVWEFWNPDVQAPEWGGDGVTRAVFYRMERYGKDYLELEEFDPAAGQQQAKASSGAVGP